MTRPPVRRHPKAVGRTVLGTVLVILGAGIFIEQVSGLDLVFIPFLIGVALMAAWVQTRCTGLLIAGSIVTAAGIGALLRPLVIPGFDDVVMNVSLAAGFLAIHLLSESRRTWPLIVSGILIVVAALDLGDVSQVVPAEVRRLGLPTVVVLAGLVLLLRDRFTRRVSALLLGVLAVIGIVLSQGKASASDLGRGGVMSPHVVEPL